MHPTSHAPVWDELKFQLRAAPHRGSGSLLIHEAPSELRSPIIISDRLLKQGVELLGSACQIDWSKASFDATAYTPH